MSAFLLPRQSTENPTGPAMPQKHLSPPYPGTNAALGGLPTVSLDVPICAVFLFLFICGAISHMTILQVNRKRGHKFLISGMMFGFCMARSVTCIMRIVWANRPTNVKIAIAANIFVAAGVVLLFIINILFAQRIVRACHPHSGWSKTFHYIFIAIYVLIVVTLLMLITSVIQNAYTLNHNTKRIDRDILLYGQTFYAVFSFLPILLVIGGIIIPRTTRVEKFGHGRFRSKVGYLLFTSFLLCLGASFRTGTNYVGGLRPATDPAWYQSKACFYIFNFTIEVMVILLHVVVRVDKRYHVPDQSKKAGDYLRGPDFYTRRAQGLMDKERADTGLESAIAPEEAVFDDMSPEEIDREDRERKRDAIDDELGIPLDTLSNAQPIQTPKAIAAPNSPTKFPPTPSPTPPLNERLAFPGEVIPTRDIQLAIGH